MKRRVQGAGQPAPTPELPGPRSGATGGECPALGPMHGGSVYGSPLLSVPLRISQKSKKFQNFERAVLGELEGSRAFWEAFRLLAVGQGDRGR